MPAGLLCSCRCLSFASAGRNCRIHLPGRSLARIGALKCSLVDDAERETGEPTVPGRSWSGFGLIRVCRSSLTVSPAGPFAFASPVARRGASAHVPRSRFLDLVPSASAGVPDRCTARSGRALVIASSRCTGVLRVLRLGLPAVRCPQRWTSSAAGGRRPTACMLLRIRLQRAQ